MRILAPEQVASYQDVGFCYAGSIEPALVEGIARQVDALAKSGTSSPALTIHDDTVFQIYDVPLQAPPLGELPFHPLVIQIASELLGDTAVVAWSLLLNKTGDQHSNWEIPWHQDTSVYCSSAPTHAPGELRGGYATFRPHDNSASQLTVARIAIDRDTADTGGIFVLPRTHLRGNQWPDGGKKFDNEPGVAVALEQGGLFFFNPLLMHRAERNQTTSQRRVVHIYYRPQRMVLPDKAQWIDWLRLRAAN